MEGEKIPEKEMGEGKNVEKIENELRLYFTDRFLNKKEITYKEILNSIMENLPPLDKEDPNYPENRDDRIVSLQEAIEMTVKQFNNWQKEYKPIGEFEEDKLHIREEVPNSAQTMIDSFIDDIIKIGVEKIEK